MNKTPYLLVTTHRMDDETRVCVIKVKDIPQNVQEFIELAGHVHFDDSKDVKMYLRDSYDDDDYKSVLWFYRLFRFLEEGLDDESPHIQTPLVLCRSVQEQDRLRREMKGVTITSVSTGSCIPAKIRPSMSILLTACPVDKRLFE